MKTQLILLLSLISLQLLGQDYSQEVNDFRTKQQAHFEKDPYSPIRKDQIQRLSYFAPDEEYKVIAQIEPLYGESAFRMATYDGTSNAYIKHAILRFKIKGNAVELTCYKNVALSKNPKYKNYLFLPFKDLTNGTETYDGGRYLELDASNIKNGTISLDFNQAFNPYCAYSNGYRCPIPPLDNHLKTAIFAGEKKYMGIKNDRLVNTKEATGFTEDEKSIILASAASEKFHVYQITDEKELAVLKNSSTDIKSDDPLIDILAQRMLKTVQDPEHAGVGIAAPQIGINRNAIWVQRFDKAGEPFEFFINPKIIWRSKLMRKGIEGCLSIPDRKEEIERSYAIRLQYWTKEGKIIEENIEGFTAVIFQHEVDHLYGILYPDRQEEQAKKELIPLQEKVPFSIEAGHTRP